MGRGGGGGERERGRGRKKVDAEQGHAEEQGVRERDRGGTASETLRSRNKQNEEGADVKGDLSGLSEARLSSFIHKNIRT